MSVDPVGTESSPRLSQAPVEPESVSEIAELPPALPARLSEAPDVGLSAAHLLTTEAPAVLPPAVEPAAPRRSRWKRVVTVLQVTSLALVSYVALFHVSVVRGSSMAPGIHDGDRIMVDHFAYLFEPVKRGDVVVLKYPLDPSVDYIKRIIGLPGDEVMLEGGKVWVNGAPLAEPYVASADALSRSYVRVQPAHYFVLGDNRPRSSDSREFGQVPMDYVRGRVGVRLWPFSRIGTVR